MANHLSTVQQVRAKYGPAPSYNECAAICNEVAWLHREEGWGVSVKRTGAYGVLRDGSRIAKDIVQNHITNEAVDVLIDAGDGGPATPAWQAIGPIADPARPWKAPIDPGGASGDPAPPPDEFEATVLQELKIIHLKVNEMAKALRQEELCNLTASRIESAVATIMRRLDTIRCKLPWGG